MSNQYSLKKLTLIYAAGNLFSQLIRFGLFFIFTFFLSKENIGLYDLIITSINLFIPIITLKIADSVLRWSLDCEQEAHLKETLTNGLIIFLLNTFVLSLVYFAANYYYPIKHNFLIYIVTILQAFYTLLLQFARGMGKNITFISGDIMYASCLAIFIILISTFRELTVEGVLIATILSLVITILTFFFRLDIQKYIDFKKINYSHSRKMLSYSLPLIPNNLSWWAISYFNKFIILSYLGISSNGLFAIALKLSSVPLLFTNIFNTAWQEKAIRSYSSTQKKEYYGPAFERFVYLIFCLILMLTAFSKPILKYLLPQDYYEIWRFLPIVYLAICFQALSVLLGSGYLSAKKTKGIFVTTMIGAGINIVFSFLLTPLFGLTGASIALSLGFLVIFIARVVQIGADFNIRFPLKKILILSALYISSYSLIISENKIIWFLNLTYAICITIFLNKKEIQFIWKRIQDNLKQTAT